MTPCTSLLSFFKIVLFSLDGSFVPPGGVGGVGGGGYSTNVYTGRLRPEVQPLNLSYPIFDGKGTPFVYLSLTNSNPFLVKSNLWSIINAAF